MIYCSCDVLKVGTIEMLELTDDEGNSHTMPVLIIREATREEYIAQWREGLPPINYLPGWIYYYEISID